jgi:hypothetical protein
MKALLMSKSLLNKCKRKVEDFSRDRFFTFERLTTFIINLTRKSLQLDLYDFTDRLGTPECTKQAFSKARNKLDPIVFQLLNQEFLKEFYSENIIKTFKGMRVSAIDGSTLRLPISQELYDNFGNEIPHTKIPLARTSLIYDVLNNLTLHASINHYKSNERSLALEHINEVSKLNDLLDNASFTKDLLLFDRGYQSLPMLAFLHKKEKHFIMRVSNQFLNEVRAVINAELRDAIIDIPVFGRWREIHPDFQDFMNKLNKDMILKVRVLNFDLNNGKRETIITSLLDQEQFTYEEIFKLYGLRWNVEEGYKYYKIIAEIENFSGKSKIAVEQDFYSTILTCNFCSILMQEAQDELEEKGLKGKYKYKINRNILIGVLKDELIDILLSDCDLDEYCESLKNRIKKNLIPVRPNRSFPRMFIRKRNKVNRRSL